MQIIIINPFPSRRAGRGVAAVAGLYGAVGKCFGRAKLKNGKKLKQR